MQTVAQLGFPIAVSAFLLMRLDDRLLAFERIALAIATRLEDQTARCNQCRDLRAKKPT